MDQIGTTAAGGPATEKAIDWDNYFKETLIEIRRLLNEGKKELNADMASD